MKHVSLYRKWRPRRFGQIVGQEPIVRTVSRAIETGRVAHAYLFSGPRGTGKTSTAKVLAMGLNCVQGPTSEPCGSCDSCRAITNNSSMDVLEMDAASNRGIDEIRELRDRVNLAPSSGRMKVYIIDEVHMLTTEAFNALLKMLEEPPEHVVFVLATTEKHKVLPTIISRCQSFDFRRPGVDTLVEKLSEIATTEGIEAEPEALAVIAREGQGSFRDAEGLLDQLASFSDGPVTAQMVRDLLGSVSSDVLLQTTTALHERRPADALRLVDRLSNEGKDLGQFVGELLAHLRRLMLLPHAPEVALAEVAGEEREALEAQSKEVPTAEVVRLVEALGESLGRAKRGGDPKLELELTFLKLARDYVEPSVEDLVRRIEELESSAAKATVPPPQRPLQSGLAEEAPRESGPPDAPAQSEAGSEEAGVSYEPEGEAGELAEGGDAEPVAEPEEGPFERDEPDESPPAEPGRPSPEAGEDLASQWRSITGELKERRQALTAAVYEEARVEGFDGSVLRLAFPEEQGFYVGMANERKHTDELKKVLERRIGTKPRIEARVDGGPPGGSSGTPPERRDEPPLGEPPDEPPPEEPSPPEDLPSGEPSPGHRGPQASATGGRAEEPGDRAVPSARGAGSGAAGGGGGDGIIRDPWEVVEMARERFGRNGDGGA